MEMGCRTAVSVPPTLLAIGTLMTQGTFQGRSLINLFSPAFSNFIFSMEYNLGNATTTGFQKQSANFMSNYGLKMSQKFSLAAENAVMGWDGMEGGDGERC